MKCIWRRARWGGCSSGRCHRGILDAHEERKQQRAVLGIEPRTSRTQSENHATRPNSQQYNMRAKRSAGCFAPQLASHAPFRHKEDAMFGGLGASSALSVRASGFDLKVGSSSVDGGGNVLVFARMPHPPSPPLNVYGHSYTRPDRRSICLRARI